MNYKIEGTPLPVVICTLSQGETMLTESGGMAWMSAGMSMTTNMEGGFKKALGRAFSGESMFLSHYTCEAQSGYIAFASSFPGSIVPIQIVPGSCIIAQKSSFLAGESAIVLSAFVNKSFKTGLFGGEGFIMQRITGQGIVFLEIDGHVVEKDLAPGEVLLCDSGHVAAMTESITMDTERIKGAKNVVFGGEGLFNTKLIGPGRVWLQTMPTRNLAQTIIPYLPKSN